MDGNIGGIITPKIGGIKIGGGGYSSGWGSFYNFTNDPNETTASKIETVNLEGYDPKMDKVREGRIVEFKPIEWMKMVATIAADPVKNLIKDVGALPTENLGKGWQGGAGLFVTAVSTFAAEAITYGVTGKKWDWAKIGAKVGGKTGSAAVNFLLSMFSIEKQVIKEGEKTITKLKWKEKGFDKFITAKIFDEGSVASSIFADMLAKAPEEYKWLTDLGIKDATKALKPGQWLKIIKQPGAFKELRKLRIGIYSDMLKDMFKGGVLESAKNLGGQMACVVGFDYALSLVSNLIQGLLEGKSWSEVFNIDNMHYGSELLKSVNKTVFAMAGRFIGYSIGCPKAGEILGSLIGSALNTIICEPFKNEFGEIDEGACAIAAAAELGGAIVGGLVAALLICGSSGPVGWIIGLGIIIGAVFTYFVTAIIYNWDKIVNFFGNVFTGIWNGICIAAEAVASAAVWVWDKAVLGAVAVKDFAVNLAVTIGNAVADFFTGAVEVVGGFFCAAGEVIGDILDGAGEVAASMWDGLTSLVGYLNPFYWFA